MSTRRLSLHQSALSPAEYQDFLRLFEEICDSDSDPVYNPNARNVGIREARGWLKGRYGASLDAATIDKILKLFYPNMGPTDILTEGQFYAVLRLLNHAQLGTDPDPSLVFVQPGSASPKKSPGAPLKRPQPPPPPSSKLDKPTNDVSPVSHSPHNPFVRRISGTPTVKPSLGSALSSDEGSLPDTTMAMPRASSSPAQVNPFHNASRPVSAVTSASGPPSANVPPLPPRKPTHLPPPPRHASLQQSTTANSTSAPALPAKPKPPPPPPSSVLGSHNISPMIKQGLLAAKGAALKRDEHNPDKIRTWEVIKTSSPSRSGRTSPGSVSPLPSRSKTISLPAGSSRKIRSTTSVSPIAGDTDGDEAAGSGSGGFSSTGTTTRLGRSKSLHQPGSPLTPPTPPPRRRPESVQLTLQAASPISPAFHSDDTSRRGSASLSSSSAPPSAPHHTTTTPSMAAAAMVDVGKRSVKGAVAAIQSQMLQARQQHTHNHPLGVRARVEGKLIPGGYGKWGEEGLLDSGNNTSYTSHTEASSPEKNTAALKGERSERGRGRIRERQSFESADSSSNEEDIRRRNAELNGWKPLIG